jgi:hypothetical protein
VNAQFGAIGQQPWFIEGALGMSFIKRSYEEVPFIKVVYLPNCRLVGPLHTLEQWQRQWIVQDNHNYEEKTVTDEDFVSMANARSLAPPVVDGGLKR